MKKIIFITLTVFILVGFGSYEKEPAYHTIANKTLEKLIYEFIEDHKGLPIDRHPYIKVRHEIWIDTTTTPFHTAKTEDVYSIQHCSEKEMILHGIVYNEPLIICNPINGKKIIFTISNYDGFIKNDINLIDSYIEDKKSDAYKLIEELLRHEEESRKHEEKNPGETLLFEPDMPSFHRRELIINFNKKGELIDTAYYQYNHINY